MTFEFNIYPGGKRKAVTMSYDDAPQHDIRLVDIFNKNGIKGTFHVNSGRLGTEGRLRADEIKDIYKGHEIACHGVYHHSMANLMPHNMVREILEDRITLEKITGMPVRGLSYANSSFNDDVIAAVKACGIAYARCTAATLDFAMPKNFLAWTPTCHHRDAEPLVQKFIDLFWPKGYLFYIWGHSHEFQRENNWDVIERICGKLGGRDDIWYATNIEIYDYTIAQRNLITTVDNSVIINPASMDVWIGIDGEPFKIGAGETVRF